MRKYTHTRAHTTRAASFDVVLFAEPTQGTAARHPARDLSSTGDHNGNIIYLGIKRRTHTHNVHVLTYTRGIVFLI